MMFNDYVNKFLKLGQSAWSSISGYDTVENENGVHEENSVTSGDRMKLMSLSLWWSSVVTTPPRRLHVHSIDNTF